MMTRSQEQRIIPQKYPSLTKVGSSKGPQSSDIKKNVFRVVELLLLGMSAMSEFLFFTELLTGFLVIELALLHASTSKKSHNGTILKSV